MKGSELTVEWARKNGLSTPIRFEHDFGCVDLCLMVDTYFCLSASAFTPSYASIPTVPFKVCGIRESFAGFRNTS